MSNIHSHIRFESLSLENLHSLTELTVQLWPECDFDEEKLILEKWINDSNHYVELVKIKNSYAGFIHMSIRYEYVEGADFNKTAYLEGVYIQSEFQKKGIARQLLTNAEKWAKSKGLKQLASDTEITNLIGQSFHQKTGFSEVNRLVCYIKDLESF